tara:strand:- start:183 stop:335 length:153 start_codon:yes stop_codon:yes gene_type:complete
MHKELKRYLRFCGVLHENYSIAKRFNGIIQLLFYGISENITEIRSKYLAK